MVCAVQLQIDQTRTPEGIVVIRLAGRLMLGPESQRIETLVADEIGKGERKFVIDATGVTHVDSTGIGRFISALNRVMQVGGTLVMAGAEGVVREGFRVTRLDTIFQFFPDVEAARKAIG